VKILLLVQKDQRVILDALYQSIAEHCECDLRWLDSDQQANLKRYFREHVELDRYERIVLFLRFKKQLKQIGFIQTLPNLVELEHDAYQNYIPCKYTGKFSAYYSKMPWVRVLSSGAEVSRRLQAEGIDAVFVPKGYDASGLWNIGLDRDIELGFVGSLKSVAYSGRKQFLDELSKLEPLLVTRTQSGDEYREMLNRIKFFVSADVGMGEYMIKNFEAMACGCVLFAYDQGETENQSLGFIDMQNVVLYSSVDGLRQKLDMLRQDPALATRIASEGQALAQTHYSFQALGQRIVDSLKAPLRQRQSMGWFARWLGWFKR
jgi:glycosyltransferase involved in cell wall biosynthesis